MLFSLLRNIPGSPEGTVSSSGSSIETKLRVMQEDEPLVSFDQV